MESHSFAKGPAWNRASVALARGSTDGNSGDARARLLATAVSAGRQPVQLPVLVGGAGTPATLRSSFADAMKARCASAERR